MKIGAQLQLAIANMDKQVELARAVGSELAPSSKEAAAEIKAAAEAREPTDGLGQNVDVEA